VLEGHWIGDDRMLSGVVQGAGDTTLRQAQRQGQLLQGERPAGVHGPGDHGQDFTEPGCGRIRSARAS
jgi:hypothetical protein